MELARILFAGHGTLLLDEPTNHLDTASITWRGFLTGHQGGLVMISHDTALLAGTVNRVFHLGPGRAALDIHSTGWDANLEQRDADERRRTRERANAGRKAAALHAQADKMRARVATAVAARNTARRAPTVCSRASNRPARREDGQDPAARAGARRPDPARRGEPDQVLRRSARAAGCRPGRRPGQPPGGAGAQRVVHGHGLRLGTSRGNTTP
ncbi:MULTISPECIES: ATP-binding cassette domain-containing protein [Streptomyces]|uniref:hypothetical protein n=1 Tax=Streptomyces TaxID=1883 RepID=UPI000AACAF53|nr:hypothetical protein [Streptomyces sp. NRRL S-475]